MNDLKRFTKNFPGGALGLFALGAIVLAVVVGSFVSTRGQKVGDSSAAANTVLSFSPASQTLSPGQNFTLVAKMNTGSNRAIGLDVEINYDPAAIEVTNIQKGSSISSFDQAIPNRNNIDNNTGTIVFGVFTLNLAGEVSGSNLDVLTISGRVRPGATAGGKTFSYNASSKVIDAVDPANVVQSRQTATITVSGGGVTPTVTTNPTNTPRPTNTPVPTNSNAQADTRLSMTSTRTQVAVNQNVPVTVQINTGTNSVIGVDLVIEYDPTYLTLSDITPGTFFTSPDLANKVIDNNTGRATVTIATPPGSNARQGTGTLANLSFRAVGQGTTRIDFGANNLVAAINMPGLNALRSATGLGMNIVQAVLLGDIDVDGDVDIVDYTRLFEHFGKNVSECGTNTLCQNADINNDGRINILDYTYVFENFGETINP